MPCDHCPLSLLGGPCAPGREACDEFERRPDGTIAHVALRGTAIEPARPASPAAGGIPLAESLALAAAMRACPFRSTDRGCGCSGGRCALRRGAIVSHLDCFDCARTYPDSLPMGKQESRKAGQQTD